MEATASADHSPPDAIETTEAQTHTLSKAPVEPVAPADESPHKEFGSEKGDFYPTELHAHPNGSHHK